MAGPPQHLHARLLPAACMHARLSAACRRVSPPQVAMHRDTGQSRGYAFVSFETIEGAEKAIAGLHNMMVAGRALRVELARADKEAAAAKPY